MDIKNNTQTLPMPNIGAVLSMLTGQTIAPVEARKELGLQVLPAEMMEFNTEKPRLKVGNTDIDFTQLSNALSQLGAEEKTALLSDIGQFIALTPQQVQQAVTKVISEEKTAIESVFYRAQLPDEMEIKQLSQAIQVMVASSFFKDILPNQSDKNIESSKTVSAVEAKSSKFIGISSSDILMELMKIIRKVVSELNISDRRISSDFLILNGKMTEAVAESIIREGKEMFKGALIGFATSMAISGAGAVVQLKSLHNQNLSIKNNLVKGNQNIANADRLAAIANNNNTKKTASPLNLKTKDGRAVDMVDSSTISQKNLAKQRTAEAAQRTQKLGQAELQKHDQVMNRERTKSSIAEQGSRLSDNAGQMATSANQVNVKEEEANKMQQQSVADIARTVSSDKDKQVDKDKDLVKQMHEHLRDIRESQLRTMQTMVRG